MNKDLIEKLESTMNRILGNKLMYPTRPVIDEMLSLDMHSIIIGSRGTGKTTLLLKEARK